MQSLWWAISPQPHPWPSFHPRFYEKKRNRCLNTSLASLLQGPKKRGVVEQPGSLHKNPIDQWILWGQFIWSKVHPVSPWSTIVEFVINWTWVPCRVCASKQVQPGNGSRVMSDWEQRDQAMPSSRAASEKAWTALKLVPGWTLRALRTLLQIHLLQPTSKYPHLPLKITVNFVSNIIIRHDAWLPMKSRYFWKFTCCYWHRRAVL